MTGVRATAKTVSVIVLTVLVIAVAVYLLYRLSNIVQMLVVALFFAVALYPAVDALVRRGVRRSLGALLVLAVLILILLAIAALAFPSLVAQVKAIVAVLRQPGGLSGEVEKIARPLGLSGLVESIRSQIDALPGQLANALGSITTVTANAVTFFGGIFTVLVFSYFLLVDGPKLIDGFVGLFPTAQQPRTRRLLRESARAISGYITGNLTISVIAGVGCYIGMSLLGVPYALALSVMLAIFDLIPLVGATLGAIGPLLAAYSVSPLKALILLAYIVVYQNIESHVLNPLVYGRSVHLPGMVVVLAVMIGGELWGIVGALIAIPVAEIIRILVSELATGRSTTTPQVAAAQASAIREESAAREPVKA